MFVAFYNGIVIRVDKKPYESWEIVLASCRNKKTLEAAIAATAVRSEEKPAYYTVPHSPGIGQPPEEFHQEVAQYEAQLKKELGKRRAQ